jgi:outer membrane lipoprotein
MEAQPPELAQQIDATLAFPDLLAAPDQYVEPVVMFSGMVLVAKGTPSQTEIELVVGTSFSSRSKMADRFRSEGRFLAVQKAFLDPAVVPPGTPLTVIGEVKGHLTRPLDENESTYPILEIKHLIDWSVDTKGGAAAFYGPPYPYHAVPYWWGLYGPFVCETFLTRSQGVTKLMNKISKPATGRCRNTPRNLRQQNFLRYSNKSFGRYLSTPIRSSRPFNVESRRSNCDGSSGSGT